MKNLYKNILKISLCILAAWSGLLLAKSAEAADFCIQSFLVVPEVTQATCKGLKPEHLAPPSQACDTELKKCQDVLGGFLQKTLVAYSPPLGVGFQDHQGGTFRITDNNVCEEVLNENFLSKHNYTDNGVEQSFENMWEGTQKRINAACGLPRDSGTPSLPLDTSKETKVEIPAEADKTATSCSLHTSNPRFSVFNLFPLLIWGLLLLARRRKGDKFFTGEPRRF